MYILHLSQRQQTITVFCGKL